MKVCKTCGVDKPLEDFPTSKRRSGSLYVRNHCYPCKYLNHDKGRDLSAYLRSYYFHHKLEHKYKAYRHRDKVCGRDSIGRDDAVTLMQQNCFYCGVESSHGLDRIDNLLGHSIGNVRPCCEKCNNILGDLPVEVKDLLIQGLTKARQGGYLGSWEIPTKRNTKRRGQLSDISPQNVLIQEG